MDTLAVANEIADQFKPGFFDDGMIRDIAAIIAKHSTDTLESQAREIELLSTKLRTALLDSAELAALKAQPSGVVLPERVDIPHRDEFESADQYAAAVGEAKKWNACLDEVARLNQPASGGDDATIKDCLTAGVPVYQLQCREIGEGDWCPADLRHYTYCQKSPEMDTRIVEVQQDLTRAGDDAERAAFEEWLPNYYDRGEDTAARAGWEAALEWQARAALPVRDHIEDARRMVRVRYTCTGKGGDYELLGLAQGAGTLKGFNHMVYRNADGVMFVREPEDFLSRMEKIAAPSPACFCGEPETPGIHRKDAPCYWGAAPSPSREGE